MVMGPDQRPGHQHGIPPSPERRIVRFPIEHQATEKVSNVAVLMPGQEMGKIGMFDEVKKHPAGREVLERFDELSVKIFKEPTTPFADEGSDPDELKRTDRNQRAVYTLSLAVGNVNKHEKHKRGHVDRPRYLAGNSMGEVTADVMAGALTAEEGFEYIGKRGKIMYEKGFKRDENGEPIPTSMAAPLGAKREYVEGLIKQFPGLAICLINPDLFVLGGPTVIVEAAQAQAKADRVKMPTIAADRAMHHSTLEDAQDDHDKLVDDTPWKDPIIPVIGTLTLEPMTTAAEIKASLKHGFAHTYNNAGIIQYLHDVAKVHRFSEVNDKGTFGKAIERVYEAISTHKVETAEVAAGIAALGLGLYEVVTHFDALHPKRNK